MNIINGRKTWNKQTRETLQIVYNYKSLKLKTKYKILEQGYRFLIFGLINILYFLSLTVSGLLKDIDVAITEAEGYNI